MSQSDSTANEHFRALSESECLELLTTTTVGRVAFAGADGIDLIPLNFIALDGEIYFRTSPESLLHALADGCDDAAFEIDHHDVYGIGWNVTVKGSTARVTDPDVIAEVMSSSRLRPWAGGDREEVIHLERRSIDGRRVRRSQT